MKKTAVQSFYEMLGTFMKPIEKTYDMKPIEKTMDDAIKRLEELRPQSQTKAIAKHLLNGNSITPIDALNKFGCFRLSARISDLRNAGFDIETEMIYQDGKRFANYYLKQS